MGSRTVNNTRVKFPPVSANRDDVCLAAAGVPLFGFVVMERVLFSYIPIIIIIIIITFTFKSDSLK